MQPKISIVTSSLNRGRFIEKAILSVLSQKWPDTEHIVIDGGSQDNTLDILKKYADKLKWVSEPDSGQSEATNKGLRMVTGDIVGLLNSDDTYLPGAFSAVAEYLTKNPSVSAVYGHYAYIDPNDRIILKRYEIPFDLGVLRYWSNYMHQPTVFFRAEVIKDVGLWDERLRYAADYEYWLRLATRGHRFALVPRLLATYRMHPDSQTVDPAHAAEFPIDAAEVRKRYWDRRIFKSKRVQDLYVRLIYEIYRSKRLLSKLYWRRSVDYLDLPRGGMIFQKVISDLAAGDGCNAEPGMR